MKRLALAFLLALPVGAEARTLVWTGAEGPAWDLASASWRVSGDETREPVRFASGDRALFLDGADTLLVTNTRAAFTAASLVFSNATDSLSWNPSAWVKQAGAGTVSGGIEVYGPLTVLGRTDAVTCDFTVRGGTLVAGAGSNWAGEYSSVCGSLHDKRKVSFLDDATLVVRANAVFGGVGSASSVQFLFDRSTVVFDRDRLIHGFGPTEFRDCVFDYRQPVDRMIFSYRQVFSGSTPYVIGNVTTGSDGRGAAFNARQSSGAYACDVVVDEIADGDDVTVIAPLIDIQTGREASGVYGITGLRKSGRGTLCLAGEGIGSTTGTIEVTEGELRVAAGTTAYDGRSALGRIDPAGRRPLSVSGKTGVLRFDAIVGPLHLPRNWTLTASDGGRIVLGEGLPFLQFGELELAAAEIDYSAVGGFGVCGRLAVSGYAPVKFPVIPGHADAGFLTIGQTTDDAARGDGTCDLEVEIADITYDTEEDVTLDLAIRDLPTDSAADNPYRGRVFRGRLRKTGAGTLGLTAANLYSGGTEIVAGTLNVDGSIPGAVAVGSAGFIGGTGAVGAVTLADGGGLAIRAAYDGTDALKVASFAAAGEVKVLLTGGYGRRLVYDRRPVLAIADRPASLDLSSWRCLTGSGEAEMSFAYDPGTGTVSITGTADIVSPDSPKGGMADYYRIDWSRDTLERTADGTWTVGPGTSAAVTGGKLTVEPGLHWDFVEFEPNEACDAQPFATFEMHAELAPVIGEDFPDAGESATGLMVHRRGDGSVSYCAIVGGGWMDLVGAVPVAGADGLYAADVSIRTDERGDRALVSFAVDGKTLADETGRSWFPRCGSGRIKGGLSLCGKGGIGDVEARRSDTGKIFATRDGTGTWNYFGTNDLAGTVAANIPYYLVLPPDTLPGTRYVTRLSSSAVSAMGLRVWPDPGMMCTLLESNGLWCVETEHLPSAGLDFIVPEGCRTFVNAISTAEGAYPLTVSGTVDEDGATVGGELVMLNGSRTTPRSVHVGVNAKLTLLGRLGETPLDVAVENGGVLDASRVAGGQSVGAIEMDCEAGFGALNGVRLTAAGELRLVHGASLRATGALPCDLNGVVEPENLMGWNFILDGRPLADTREFAYDCGRVTWRCPRYPEVGSAGWTCLPIWGGGYMMDVCFTPVRDLLYCHADVCGPFRSEDGGVSWTGLAEGFNLGLKKDRVDEIRTLLVDPRDPDSLVAIAGGGGRVREGGFLVSRNGGKSWRKTWWTAAYGNGGTRMLGRVLVRDPENPDTLVGGEDWYGIYLSRDNGETWTRTGPTERLYTCIHWDRKVSGRVYACAKAMPDGASYSNAHPDRPREGGFFLSEDGGASWRKIADEAPVELTQIPGDDRLVGIFGFTDVKVSTDGGFTWTDFSTGISKPSVPPTGYGAEASLAALGSGTNLWLVGTGLGGLYTRPRGAEKWTSVTYPRPNYATTDPEHEIYESAIVAGGGASVMIALASIDVDPRDDKHWFTTDWFTLWETKDAGKNFTSRNVGISQLCSGTFEADPLDARYLTYGVHDMTVYVSYDGGQRFRKPVDFKTDSYGGTTHVVLPSVAYSPYEPGLMFGAGYDVGGGFGLSRSTDHGEHWACPTCAGLPKRVLGTNGVCCVAFRAGRPDEVWACEGGVVGPGNGGPYVSTDRGESWTWMGQGIREGATFYSPDQDNGGPIHGIVFSSDGSGLTCSKNSSTVYRWDETEKRWKESPLPGGFGKTWKGHALEADPFTPGRFLMGGTANVAETLDGGRSWRLLPGFTGECAHFCFDPNTPGLLVLACADAIRVSWDYGKTFDVLPGGWAFDGHCTSLNTSQYSGGSIVQITADRRRLFVATPGSGVFRRDLTPPKGVVLRVR